MACTAPSSSALTRADCVTAPFCSSRKAGLHVGNDAGGFRRRLSLQTGRALFAMTNDQFWRRRPQLLARGQSPDHQRGEVSKGPEDSTESLISQADWIYFGKLAGGCTAAAIAIKYGSLLFPLKEIASLPLALGIICTPVIVSLLLLARASRIPSPFFRR